MLRRWGKSMKTYVQKSFFDMIKLYKTDVRIRDWKDQIGNFIDLD